MRMTRLTLIVLIICAFPPYRSPAQDSQEPRFDFEGQNCRIERDLDRPGKPVVKIAFGCHSNATDTDLAKLKTHPELREVDLLSDKITDAGLDHLKTLTHLETLRLNSSTITDKGLGHVAAVSTLRELVLFRTPVTADGLSRLQNMPALRKLCLVRIPITSECVAQLKELTKLQTLDFEQLRPESRAKAADLVRLLPETTITFSR